MVSFCNLVNTCNRMENSEKFRPDPKPRRMDQVRQALNAIVCLHKRVLHDELLEVLKFSFVEPIIISVDRENLGQIHKQEFSHEEIRTWCSVASFFSCYPRRANCATDTLDEAKTLGRKSTALYLVDADMWTGMPSVQEADYGRAVKSSRAGNEQPYA